MGYQECIEKIKEAVREVEQTEKSYDYYLWNEELITFIKNAFTDYHTKVEEAVSVEEKTKVQEDFYQKLKNHVDFQALLQRYPRISDPELKLPELSCICELRTNIKTFSIFQEINQQICDLRRSYQSYIEDIKRNFNKRTIRENPEKKAVYVNVDWEKFGITSEQLDTLIQKNPARMQKIYKAAMLLVKQGEQEKSPEFFNHIIQILDSNPEDIAENPAPSDPPKIRENNEIKSNKIENLENPEKEVQQEPFQPADTQIQELEEALNNLNSDALCDLKLQILSVSARQQKHPQNEALKQLLDSLTKLRDGMAKTLSENSRDKTLFENYKIKAKETAKMVEIVLSDQESDVKIKAINTWETQCSEHVFWQQLGKAVVAVIAAAVFTVFWTVGITFTCAILGGALGGGVGAIPGGATGFALGLVTGMMIGAFVGDLLCKGIFDRPHWEKESSFSFYNTYCFWRQPPINDDIKQVGKSATHVAALPKLK